jgi:hypothetical protein
MMNSPRFVVKHIGWSLKKPTHDQNQPKSLPIQTHRAFADPDKTKIVQLINVSA